MKATTGLLGTFFLLGTSCSAGSESGRARVDFARVTTSLEAVEMAGIERLHTLSGVYLAGQPTGAAIRAAKAGGLRSIIDLRHDDENLLDERALAQYLGLRYYRLAWNGAEELNDEIFDRARDLLRIAERPVLLHCRSAERVGAVWLPHRVLDEGASFEQSLREAKTIGLNQEAYEFKARDYVRRKSI